MYAVTRSAAFKRHLLLATRNYRDRASSTVALAFVDQIEAAVGFIRAKPYACPVYLDISGTPFRKWRVGDFPYSIFFRVDGTEALVLEALYAHRMDVLARLPLDTGKDDSGS